MRNPQLQYARLGELLYQPNSIAEYRVRRSRHAGGILLVAMIWNVPSNHVSDLPNDFISLFSPRLLRPLRLGSGELVADDNIVPLKLQFWSFSTLATLEPRQRHWNSLRCMQSYRTGRGGQSEVVATWMHIEDGESPQPWVPRIARHKEPKMKSTIIPPVCDADIASQWLVIYRYAQRCTRLIDIN